MLTLGFFLFACLAVITVSAAMVMGEWPYYYVASWVYSFFNKKDLYYYELVNNSTCHFSRKEFRSAFGLGVDLTYENYQRARQEGRGTYMSLYGLRSIRKYKQLLTNRQNYRISFFEEVADENEIKRILAELRALE